MNKKEQREFVFNKYGGKCSYCGCELQKGWHMDHAEPVLRYTKIEGRGMFLAGTDEKPSREDIRKHVFEGADNIEHREGKKVTVMQRPENDTFENLMPSCQSCNINKHGLSIDEFRGMIARFVASLNKNSLQYKLAKKYGLIQETGKEVQFYFETIKID